MTIPFACDMTAIPTDLRSVHHRLIRHLMTEAVERVQELPDGFGFRFPAGEYDSVTEFVERERLCCPFLGFTLEVTPDQASLVLRITGPEGVKDFVRAELHLPGA
jgi:hypothetical protein